MEYPVTPQWFELETTINHDLIIPTNKAMGKDQNRQAVIHTLREKYQDYLHVYTDGSKSEDNKTGAAFWVPQTITSSKWRLPDFTSITGAEMSAIHIATSWLLKLGVSGRAVILTDSNTSLHLIKHRKPKTYIHSTTKIQNNLIQLKDRGWDLIFQWIPSHCNILGNDTLEELANDARSLLNITYPPELSDKLLYQEAHGYEMATNLGYGQR